MKHEPLKGTDKDPNSLLPKAVAEKFEVVDWKFGPLIHHPKAKGLGKPNGRVCLTDMDLAYAEKLVKAEFPHLKRKETKAAKAVEAPADSKGK